MCISSAVVVLLKTVLTVVIKSFSLVITLELTNDYNRKNNKTLLPPFNGLTNEAMSLYTLQLSAYQIPIQKQLNIPILGRRIVWLKDNGTYEIIPTEDKTDELFNVLSTKIA